MVATVSVAGADETLAHARGRRPGHDRRRERDGGGSPAGVADLREGRRRAVASRLDLEARVEHDASLVGLVSGTPRQVDVLTGTLGGESFTLAIECKRYARRIGIGKVSNSRANSSTWGLRRALSRANERLRPAGPGGGSHRGSCCASSPRQGRCRLYRVKDCPSSPATGAAPTTTATPATSPGAIGRRATAQRYGQAPATLVVPGPHHARSATPSPDSATACCSRCEVVFTKIPDRKGGDVDNVVVARPAG